MITETELFNRLREESQEFRSLAERYWELDIQIGAYDRIFYLNHEQEGKLKELRIRNLRIKNEMFAMMRTYRQKHQS